MNCPKCVGALIEITYGETIRLHRCEACAGLFCDPQSLAAMQREYLAEASIDIGDPSVGRALDDMDEVCCPRCSIPMEPTYDPEQTHIWYEICSNCNGIWLDAGELTDLKYQTLMDRIRGLLRRPSPNRRPQTGSQNSA
ncbi:MAG: zf-TFIIB domain-containing protein [Pseudomonadota bacterium]